MKKLLVMIASLLLVGTSHAHDYKIGNLSIAHPWAKASREGQKSGGGYILKITNSGAEDTLISVSSPISKLVELHTMSVGNDQIMRMSEVDGIPIPRQTSDIRPGAYHIMFIDLNETLHEGQTFPATLEFKTAGRIQVEFVVEKPDFNPHNDTSSSSQDSHEHATSSTHIH